MDDIWDELHDIGNRQVTPKGTQKGPMNFPTERSILLPGPTTGKPLAAGIRAWDWLEGKSYINGNDVLQL